MYYEKCICEVYGQNSDIDSIALAISTTSWILSNLHDLKDNSKAEPIITLSLSERIDNRE